MITHRANDVSTRTFARRIRRRVIAVVAVVMTVPSSVGFALATPARADALGYLVNVTMRPGYQFADADAALAYGYQLCDQTRTGTSYPDLMRGVRSDLATEDEFQASYLIGQAIDQLCPSELWLLRHSAGGYTPGAAQ